MSDTSTATRRRALKLGLAASLAAPVVISSGARAQAWPPGTITWINPFRR